SFDARLDESLPVVVEFQKEWLPTNLLPDKDQLLETFKRCLDYSKKLNNEKATNFYNKAIHILKEAKISSLRVSDYNTTGLTGSKDEEGGNWYSLINSTGQSSKPGSAGGSYGIGKSAPLACSALRTVLYSTFDRDG